MPASNEKEEAVAEIIPEKAPVNPVSWNSLKQNKGIKANLLNLHKEICKEHIREIETLKSDLAESKNLNAALQCENDDIKVSKKKFNCNHWQSAPLFKSLFKSKKLLFLKQFWNN